MALLAQAGWEDRKREIEEIALLPDLGEAEAVLLELAGLFSGMPATPPAEPRQQAPDENAHTSSLEAKYRALLEQIPAVVFMAYLDRGISEAYVSPQIEASLG